jgi:hypothetical protein
MRVLFPEYRLAPEHPFPAAIDDVLAARRWLRTGQDLGASSIAVAGDSAGEGLPHVYQLLLGTPRQPRPPSGSGSSCGHGFADRTVHRQQASRRVSNTRALTVVCSARAGYLSGGPESDPSTYGGLMLDGVLFFPVTPFGPDGTVDYEALAEHVRRGMAAGLTGEVSRPRMAG